MALIFCDSFDHYETADISRKWSSNANSTISTSSGRRGGGCLNCNGGSASANITLPAQTTYGIGFAIKRNTNASFGRMLQFKEGSTVHVEVRIEAGGFFSALRGGTVQLTPFGTIARGIEDEWIYVECKCFVHDSTGTVEVKVNGEQVLNLTGQDTANGGTPTINGIQVAGQGLFDDLVIWDLNGSNNTDYLGDVEVEMVLPDGAGNSTQWTNVTGAATHWQAVDESPAVDDLTTYIDTSTNTHLDLFTFANLSSITGGSTVLGVQVSAIASVDSGSATIRLVKRPTTVNFNGGNHVLGTGWLNVREIWETDLQAVAAWTDTTFNASEFGVEKVA